MPKAAALTEAVAPMAGLRLRSVSCIPVELPLRYVLGTSAATVRAAPLLLVEVLTEQGITGRSYVFCYRRSGAKSIAAVLHDAAELVRGDNVAPLAMATKLERRFALIGVTGVVRMALSALDMALWDALAIAAGTPLACLLGGTPRPVRAYNSCGLGLMSPQAAADEAQALLEGGMQAVKLRLGYATLAEDLAVTRAVRSSLPAAVELLVDYNQALSRVEALERGRALQSEGVAWLEEPIRHDDLAGNAEIARTLDLPLQLGENFDGPKDMLRALQAGALRPRDARCRAHRRRQRLDAGGRGGAGPRCHDELAPHARGQRPIARRHAHGAFPRVRRLDRRDRQGTGAHRERLLADGRASGHRPGLGCRRRGTLPHRLTGGVRRLPRR